jgi:hypothetical protein
MMGVAFYIPREDGEDGQSVQQDLQDVVQGQ